MPVVVQNIARTQRDIATAFARFGVATVHEAQGRKGLMAPHINPIWPGARVSGTAVTVQMAPCDNWMLHVVVEQCRPGDIVVASPTSFSDAGYFGDLLATTFRAHGVIGLVIDAGCRDIAELTKIGFPVWAKCASAQGTVKETLGDINVPIVCAGQIVNPGDVIVADDDGAVVVRREEAEEVLQKTRAREDREAGVRKRYAAGELGIDINNMRPALEAKGLRYIDQKDLA
jgi:4-hydroxy-4-methyl-2-oxoglutarate aldolase